MDDITAQMNNTNNMAPSVNIPTDGAVPTPPPPPPPIDPALIQPDDEKSLAELAQRLNEIRGGDTTPKVEEKTYEATPTPLPNMPQTADILPDSSAPLPPSPMTEDSIGPVAQSLNDIMPDYKKPKALERSPKDNNLANPSNLKKEEDIPIEENIQQDIDIPVPEPVIPEPLHTTTSDTPIAPQVQPEPVAVETGKKYGIDDLLKITIDKGASDLHLTVGYPAIIRIDGALQEVNDQILSPQDVEELIFPLLSEEKKELLEVNRELDFAHEYQGDVNARFRVNAFFTMKHLSAAFRMIPLRIRTIEELKLPQIYHQFTKLKQGLILVTGPTGHGKSTTLAAMIEDINQNEFRHILTIEDPIEYVFEGKKSLIDQREMNDDTHSWTIALKSALRQDPDVILVGEMRDYETISAAITLAETGHLVFGTLHTNNSAQTVDRVIDVFPENQQPQVRSQLSNILEAIVAQRLVPLDKGGRRAVSEILVLNPAVRNLIREGRTHQIDNAIRTSSDLGMVSLERSLVNLVREGAISVQRAQEYAVYPEEVLRLLKT